jgi:hypothetical protein
MLLGQKVNPRVAGMRTLPEGVDQRSASRHPDWTGPDDLEIKIEELREITDWEKPIYVKVGATRVFNDVKLAVHAGADVVVVDGMQGGTAATQTVFIEHVGIPTLAAVRQAVDALEDMNMVGKVQLIVSGGIRTGAAPEPSEPSEAERLPLDGSNEPAADAPPVAPPAPQARPIAVVPASPPPAPTPAPVPVAAPAWGVPIRLHLPTLALLTMLIPAGVAAAWALGGRTHRPGEA